MGIEKETRDGFGSALVSLAEMDSDIVSLDCDLGRSTRAYNITEADEKRFFDIGISEQDMISTAAGMASCGKNVFASTFAVFLTGRGYDQIRQQIALPCLNVRLCGSSAGLTQGPDGATHQSVTDIGLMRMLPNMTVMSPADYYQAEQVTAAAALNRGPVYIRLSRFPTLRNVPEDLVFKTGKAQILRKGEGTVVCGTGPILQEINKAAYLLSEKGINIGVVNFHTIKPIDSDLIISLMKEYGTIISVEEHNVIGGLGSAIAEVVSENNVEGCCRLFRHGVQDCFGESGTAAELLRKYNLDAAGIAGFIEAKQ